MDISRTSWGLINLQVETLISKHVFLLTGKPIPAFVLLNVESLTHNSFTLLHIYVTEVSVKYLSWLLDTAYRRRIGLRLVSTKDFIWCYFYFISPGL